MTDKLIKLNVGGVHYVTTRTTLCTYPDSMLGAMFKGTMETTKDENGCFFIDRDGELFKYILNFLRSSELALPSDFKRLDELRLESNFYQITSLNDRIDNFSKLGRSLPTNVYYMDVLERVGRWDYTQICGRKRLIDLNFHGLVDVRDIRDWHQFVVVKTNPDLTQGDRSCVRFGEILRNNGWELINSEMTTLTEDSRTKIVYKERWSFEELKS